MKNSSHLLHRITQSRDSMTVRFDLNSRAPLRDSDRTPPTGNPGVVIAVVLTVVTLAAVSLYLNR